MVSVAHVMSVLSSISWLCAVWYHMVLNGSGAALLNSQLTRILIWFPGLQYSFHDYCTHTLMWRSLCLSQWVLFYKRIVLPDLVQPLTNMCSESRYTCHTSYTTLTLPRVPTNGPSIPIPFKSLQIIWASSTNGRT